MRKIGILLIIVMALTMVVGCDTKEQEVTIYYTFNQTVNGESFDTEPMSTIAEPLPNDLKVGIYPLADSVFTANSDEVTTVREFYGEKLTYKQSRFTDSKTQSTDFNQIFDEYVSENRETRVEIIRHNGCVRRYSKKASVTTEQTRYDQNQLQKIAEQFILSIISPEEFSEYRLSTVQAPGESIFDEYVFGYYREVCGIGTDETIGILVNTEGIVVEYTANNLKKYSSLSKKITKEKLDTVADIMKNQVNKAYPNARVYDKYHLTTDTSGNVYVQLDVSLPGDRGDCFIYMYAKA